MTHECDFPPEAQEKPTVLRTTLPPGASGQQIDEAVARAVEGKLDLFTLDAALLRELSPDLLVIQGLCDVCAVPEASVVRAVRTAGMSPGILELHPHSLTDILGNILAIGETAGHQDLAEGLVASLRDRIEAVERKGRATAHRPKVFCMEWLDPPYCSGHWVPEMVDIAGGREVLGLPGEPSTRVTPEDILRADPEVVVVMPCSFDIPSAEAGLKALMETGAPVARVVRGRRTVVVDGHAHFSRPGPRVVEGIEILAHVLHPEVFGDPAPRMHREFHAR